MADGLVDAAPVDVPLPAGFRTIDVGGGYIAANGPLHAAWRDGQLVLGLRIEPRHCNPAMQCHGGMLTSFADMLLPYAAMYDLEVPRRFTPTISLHVDFVAPAPLGSWIEGTATVVRSTRSLLFVQGLVFIGAEPVMRASGIFKWGEPIAGGDPLDPFGLRRSSRGTDASGRQGENDHGSRGAHP